MNGVCDHCMLFQLNMYTWCMSMSMVYEHEHGV